MQGSVTAVSPTSTVSSNVVTYSVTIALDSPPSSVRLGMTANVTVITGSKTNVLVVPNSAITTTGNSSTVTVLKNGQQATKSVVVGLVGSSDTEIVSGLSVGEVVVESTSTSASTGSSTSNSSTGGPGGLGGFGGGFGGGAP